MTGQRMRVAAATVLTLCAGGVAHAADKADDDGDRGYSYFIGLARQELRYQEKVSVVPVRSRAKTSSPILITGALFPVTENGLISLHSENTFFPGSTQERWTAQAPVLGTVTLTQPVVQTNGFSLNQSTTQLLGHYRMGGDLFAIGGLTLRSQSFKRFDFALSSDQAVALPLNSIVEESSSEAVVSLGAGIDSETVRERSAHYGLRAGVGIPVWRRVTNTNNPSVQFSGTRGYDLEIEGRYSWSVFRNAHLGVWSKYVTALRLSESRQVGVRTLELPTNRTDSLGLGLELLWKL